MIRRKPLWRGLSQRFWVCVLLGVVIPGTSALAAEVSWDTDTVRTVLKDEIERIELLARDADVIAAVAQQNAKPFDRDETLRLDQLWRLPDQLLELKQAQQTSPLGKQFQTILAHTPGYTELLLTDRNGINVAIYPLTTDLWQGDEDKWLKVVEEGWAVYVSPMEWDESSGKNAVQLSVPVKQGDEVIGALIVGIKLSHILAKQVTGAGRAK